jgi:hypothetical protein
MTSLALFFLSADRREQDLPQRLVAAIQGSLTIVFQPSNLTD